MEKTEKDPSLYIDSLPAESREALSRLDTLISRVMAVHSRALWVGPFHISLYVNAVQDGRYVSESFGPKLGKVKVGKASISFKRLEDVDLEALTEVLKIARDEMPEATQ